MAPRAMSQTPGPATRLRSSRQNTPQAAPPSAAKQKPTALPAASVGTSSGYGAPGKPVIQTQLATFNTNLTSILQNARAPSQAPSAIEEEEDHDEDDLDVRQSVASKTPSRRDAWRSSNGTRRRTAQTSIVRGVDGEDEVMMSPPLPPTQRREVARPGRMRAAGQVDASEMSREGTLIDHVAGYEEGRIPDYEPGNLTLAAHTLPRYVPQALSDFNKDVWSFLKAILILFLLLAACLLSLTLLYAFGYALISVLSLLSTSTALGPHFRALFGRSSSPPMSELERLWIEFRSTHTNYEVFTDKDLNKTKIDEIQSGAIQLLYDRMDEWERRHKMNAKTIQRLEEMLPQAMAAQEIDGHLVIPDVFWNALEQRMRDDGAPLWDAFLQSNQAQVQTLVDGAVMNGFQTLERTGRVITPADFAKAVAKNYQYMETHFKDEIRKAERQMTAEFRKVAIDASTEVISKKVTSLFSSSQLELLAKANQVRNTYEALHQVNFFSPGHGARADPVNSSPTFGKGKTWLQRYLYPGHPPIAALQRWEEATDCWCASPSTEMGRAQLTVKMGYSIFPEKLVVEHIPHQGTLNISTAPRELEIWIVKPASSPNTAEQLRETVKQNGYSSDYCAGPPPSKDHICIGAGRYDIHTQDPVQTIPMFVDTAMLGLAAKTITVRVAKNWGGEATCLYRLRMTGSRADPQS